MHVLWFACCGFADGFIRYGLDPWVDLRSDHVGKKLALVHAFELQRSLGESTLIIKCLILNISIGCRVHK